MIYIYIYTYILYIVIVCDHEMHTRAMQFAELRFIYISLYNIYIFI